MNETTTLLAKQVASYGERAQYDAECKKFLSNRELLSRILQETVDEFKEMPIEQIKNCIDSDISVSSTAVHQDMPDLICGDNIEDKSSKEGDVYFDIKFRVKIPKTKEVIQLIINVEAQKDQAPGYPIESRGIYYCSRMISNQKGREFSNSEYGNIVKVYSIWLCMNCSEDSITELCLQPKIHTAGYEPKRSDYDLMSVVIVHLTAKYTEDDTQQSTLFNILNILLEKSFDNRRKIELLEKNGLPMTEELKGDVNIMCNWSLGIIESSVKEGLEKGLSQGLNQGLRQGEKIGIAKMLRKIMKNYHLTLEEACVQSDIPENEYEEYASLIEQIDEEDKKVAQAKP